MKIEKIENDLIDFYLIGDPSDVIQGYVKSLKNSETWEVGVFRQDQIPQIKKAKMKDAFSLINLQPYDSLVINKKDQELKEFYQLYQMFFDSSPESQMRFKLITAVVFLNFYYKTEIENINITEKLSEFTFNEDQFKFRIDQQKIEFISPFTGVNYVAT